MLVPDMVLLLKMRIMYICPDIKDKRAVQKCESRRKEIQRKWGSSPTGWGGASTAVSPKCASELMSICSDMTRICSRKYAQLQ